MIQIRIQIWIRIRIRISIRIRIRIRIQARVIARVRVWIQLPDPNSSDLESQDSAPRILLVLAEFLREREREISTHLILVVAIEFSLIVGPKSYVIRLGSIHFSS